jgi:hypothetical protein
LEHWRGLVARVVDPQMSQEYCFIVGRPWAPPAMIRDVAIFFTSFGS